MLFNSVEFVIFLVIVFCLYWFATRHNPRIQNILLLLASYFFYGWWDWRFLSLILFSSIVDYFIGLLIYKNQNANQKRLLLLASLTVNLGLLGFFKYFNFFTDSLVDAFTFFGYTMEASRLDIILPVGISFYTFQTMSYTIDIYRSRIKPTKDPIAFFTFVSFFPQLVAGPIERASNLLPQFLRKREFKYDYAVSGVKLIVWGIFKKVVIADNAAILVDGIFNNYQQQSSIALMLGAVFFAFQIYGDFSGYSDIAIGISRIFGFDLMTNFKFPYLSRNISEFWKRWHISLSTWFRDYLYIPLGGSRISEKRALMNIIIVFIVSGFWHGANWTFIIWGTIHGMLYIPLFINGKKIDDDFPNFNLKNIFSILITFTLVCLAWVYFRADSVSIANDYLYRMVTFQEGSNYALSLNRHKLVTGLLAINIFVLIGIEAFFAKRRRIEVQLSKKAMVTVILLIIFTGAFKNHVNFIYFQF